MVCAYVCQGRKPPPHHKGCIRGLRPKKGLIDLSKSEGTIGPLGTPSPRHPLFRQACNGEENSNYTIAATAAGDLGVPTIQAARRLLLVSGSGAGGAASTAAPCAAGENCPAEAAAAAAWRAATFQHETAQ